MNQDFKELKKSLKNAFIIPSGNEYSMIGALYSWMKQSGVKNVNETKINIIHFIFDGIPYPYVEKDRLKILNYLKKNKGITMKRLKKFYKAETTIVIGKKKTLKTITKIKELDYITYKRGRTANFDAYSLVICIDFTLEDYDLLDKSIYGKKLIYIKDLPLT